MILRYKSQLVSQSDIVKVGGLGFNWGNVEKRYGINDNNSFVSMYGISKSSQIGRAKKVFNITKTPGILKLTPIRDDNYISYVIVTGVDNNELMIVDPFYNGKIETASEYASRNGCSVSKFYSRLSSFWAYN